MLVGGDDVPINRRLAEGETCDDFQFFVAAEIVADVVIMNYSLAAALFHFGRIVNQGGDGNGCAAAAAKNLAAFFAA